MKSAYKVFLAGLCSLLLLACGGGGSISDDGSGTPPTPSAEESPDDLQINHQIRVEAHLVA